MSFAQRLRKQKVPSDRRSLSPSVCLCLLATRAHRVLVEALGPLCCQHAEESSPCSPHFPVDPELAAASSSTPAPLEARLCLWSWASLTHPQQKAPQGQAREKQAHSTYFNKT